MRRVLVLFFLLCAVFNYLSAQEPISAKLSSNESADIIPPQFAGGNKEFYKYLSDHVVYPPILIKIKLEGSMDLKFTIDKDGKTKNIEIIRGFDPDADNEVVKVLERMPLCTPANENGNITEYTYLLNVTFKITDDLINQSKTLTKEIIKDTVEATVLPIIAEQPQPNIEIKTDSLNRDPQFPGGQDALDAYFKTKLKYPKRAIEYGIEGRVVFSLEISSEGKISNIMLYKGLFYECNEEAFYLIKKMPDWIPGLKDGKPATKRIIVPVPFILPK